MVNMLQQTTGNFVRKWGAICFSSMSVQCCVLNQNLFLPSMLNHTLPFCAHFPYRYQSNASKVPVYTLGRGNQIPVTRSLRQLNFWWWCLICVSLQPGTCIVSGSWLPRHWCGAWICKRYVHPQLKVLCLSVCEVKNCRQFKYEPEKDCSFWCHEAGHLQSLTNIPVNIIAIQLEKNAWKHTEGGSATDCGKCGTVGDVEKVHQRDFLWPQKWHEIWQKNMVKMCKQLLTILQIRNL